jgi:hypothetical protein
MAKRDETKRPWVQGSKQYAKNTTCADCGATLEGGFLYCLSCGDSRLEYYHGMAGRKRTTTGPNRIACCGRFVTVLTNPLRTTCCGRVLSVSEEGGA